jgi:hypothetical protein
MNGILLLISSDESEIINKQENRRPEKRKFEINAKQNGGCLDKGVVVVARGLLHHTAAALLVFCFFFTTPTDSTPTNI